MLLKMMVAVLALAIVAFLIRMTGMVFMMMVHWWDYDGCWDKLDNDYG